MSRFSDIRLTLPPDSQKYHDIFESRHVTSYHESYADERLHNGQSLRDGTYFGIKVRGIEKLHRSWTVSARRSKKEEETLRSTKLIIATGHTMIPYMPTPHGQILFREPVLHQKEFGKATCSCFRECYCFIPGLSLQLTWYTSRSRSERRSAGLFVKQVKAKIRTETVPRSQRQECSQP